ncbi:MAG: peptidylprolyl isomerase, partial [Pseudomonadota bacterium]
MNTKALLRAITFTFTLGVTSGLHAATEVVDQVVAIVDDDIIMASELRERVDALEQSIIARGMEVPPRDTLIRQTLDRLILESIQLQMGMRVGVRISDSQLNGAVQRIASQNGLNQEQFIAALEEQGQSYPAFREQIRREMVIQRVQGGNVSQRIQITPKEIDNFLATEDGKQLTQSEYHLLHGLLAVPPDAAPEQEAEARAYTEQVLANIRNGEQFEAAIRATSTGPYPFSGGDLGWRKAEDLPSLFADIAPQLSVGATSEPIRSPSGFHLIYMEDLRGGEQMVSQTQVRHILVKPSEIMTDDQAKDLVVGLRSRVEQGEEFGDLAREYSEDIGSAQEGGDLGWTMPGQMVPEFQQAMDATAVGEMSDPVRTQFGW